MIKLFQIMWCVSRDLFLKANKKSNGVYSQASVLSEILSIMKNPSCGVVTYQNFSMLHYNIS